MSGEILLTIDDFRAIRHADIRLDGITVVSGINGCGKSTISKLLYGALRDVNQYERIVVAEYMSRLMPYLLAADQIDYYQRRLDPSRRRRPMLTVEWRHASSLADMDALLGMLRLVAKSTIELESSQSTRDREAERQRIASILSSLLVGDDAQASLDQLVTRFVSHAEEIVRTARKRIEERPYQPIERALGDEFGLPKGKAPFSLRELGVTLAGHGTASPAPIPHLIRRVAYIDTPMAIGLPPSESLPSHWTELNALLRQKPQRGYRLKINNVIKHSIRGNVAFRDEDYGGGTFVYTRDDGREFELQTIATGIRSFAAMQMLLKSGFLAPDTLLVLDEPEAHLHPQWVVEYARLILLIHRLVGTRFFIATHSPDMVSALKSVGEAMEVDDINFYVAQPTGDGAYTFGYCALETDIEPIFESFNKSLDQIETYSANGRTEAQ